MADFIAFLGRRALPHRPRPVARDRCAAYILATFQSSLMTLSGFARTGGRSAEEIYHGDRAPDAESDSRVAGRKHFVVIRPDRAALQPASAGSEGDRRRRC